MLRRQTMRVEIALLLAAVAVTGCENNIGDGCGNSSDCSVTGERQCDLAQPGGYCTVFSCDPDTCPEGACIEWRFIPSRTAETWCMQTCGGDGDCRREYSCVLPSNLNAEGEWQPEVPIDERIARTTDLAENLATAKICTALSATPPSEQTRNELLNPALLEGQ
jgi:hypothetical protein